MATAIPRMVGNINKLAILDIIKRIGKISRADIARELSLSGPAVSKNIAVLLDIGIVREIGADVTSMGRKPVLLEFNREFKYVASIDIGGRHIRGALADLSGEVVFSESVLSYTEQGAEKVIGQVIEMINLLIAQCAGGKERMAAIAINNPGINDSKSGKTILTTFINAWDQINLKERIEEEFRIPVIVENDVDMDIIGEQWRGVGGQYKHLLYLKLGDGLATRIMINGTLYHGANLAAGEIGYMIPDIKMIRDNFSARGVLEECICNGTVYKEYVRLGGRTSEQPLTLGEIIERADEGDEVAGEITRQTIKYLTVAIINSVSVLDCEAVILGGEISRLNQDHLAEILRVLKNNIPFTPRLLTSKLGNLSGITGGIKVALDRVHQDMEKFW